MIHAEAQEEWLHKKGKLHGFRLLEIQISQPSHDRGRVRREETVHTLTLLTVQYDGILQVCDDSRFAITLSEGIGSAKAFGCGLLSLAPAR